MAVSLKPLREQVIVITGGSSGIGLATARAAVEQGARVVLAARNEAALSDIVKQIEGKGGQALAVAADVGRQEDVQRIRDAAIERFGGFDTWVNDAGVDIWGYLEQISDADNRRLFDTNFWGTVYGSLAALTHLKEHGGALINVGSVASDRAFPLQGMYSASKHAVKGFTDALRVELEQAGAPVSVTLVKPAAIGTPLAEQAKNYLDQEPKLPSPLYAPEEVARAILHAAMHPERDIYVGSIAKVLSVMARAAPRTVDRFSERNLFDAQLRKVPAHARRDNLHQAGPGGGRVRADPDQRSMHASVYTRASLHPFVTATALAAAGVALASVLAVAQKKDV